MNKDINNISVVGSGAWGTALAQVLSLAGRQVTLFARTPAMATELDKIRLNHNYLPGILLNRDMRITSDLSNVKGSGIILMVTPVQFARNIMVELRSYLDHGAVLVNCSKGIEISTGKLVSEIAAEVLPGLPYAVLSGPTFASEVARGLPAAVTLATKENADRAKAWAEKLSSRTFRPYLSSDPAGAEIAGALKNVIAIACGIVEGKGLGHNARAAVMTRGMAEIKRFGMKKGANTETFLGLSGLGDLTLTCNSMTSRNFSLGVALGQGRKLKDIMAERRAVSEGVYTTRAVAGHAHEQGVDMPICGAVDKVLHQQIDVNTVIDDLMSRDLKQEGK